MPFSSLKLLSGGLLALLTNIGIPAAQDLPVWRHGITEAKSSAGFVAMVSQPGFAEKFGLKIEITQLANDALLQRAVLAGSLDSYEGGPALVAASRGGGIKVVGCSWLGISIGLFAHSDITELSQLPNRKIAASAPGSLPELLTRVAMRNHGVDPAQSEFIALGSDPERYKSVLAGVVDAAALDMEHEANIEEDKLNIVSAFEEEFPGYARFCIQMSDRSVVDRHDDAVNFLAAEMVALQYALDNPEETISLTQKLTSAPLDDPRARNTFDHVIRNGNIRPDLPVPTDKIQEWHDILQDAGVIETPVDMSSFLDSSLREEAAHRVETIN